MEIFFKIVSLLGGLAMFLYGMRIMGDGLKSTSGGAMKAALARVTDKPFKGFFKRFLFFLLEIFFFLSFYTNFVFNSRLFSL